MYELCLQMISAFCEWVLHMPLDFGAHRITCPTRLKAKLDLMETCDSYAWWISLGVGRKDDGGNRFFC
ncbi:hypothetical protein GE061_000107 [Apolygus lucorum]|uniref:Uncharacterized protein n=1 Tax=Apolygus lucorum TaxID=248454 RepID=A0A8S9Y3A0_APOLU|nr:hypothetical protein GE061_000107 [Apolygus lucorum]